MLSISIAFNFMIIYSFQMQCFISLFTIQKWKWARQDTLVSEIEAQIETISIQNSKPNTE